MIQFAVQFLEPPPPEAGEADIRRCLREACRRLPISRVLLGWNLPERLELAAAEEAGRQNAVLYRWQPWLTADSLTDLPQEWATIGWSGEPIPGHGDSPDFSFVCPNRSGVADFLPERFEAIASRGLYRGIFLDRIRYPSPSPNPASHLGCFCKHCRRLAAEEGLVLDLVREEIRTLFLDAPGQEQFIQVLFKGHAAGSSLLPDFLDFRARAITRTVQQAKQQADSLGLSLGLDCFTPALSLLVGQDLTALSRASDWIKLMLYPRVFGSAGISFEVYGLARWLVDHCLWAEEKALNCLRRASGMDLPASLETLRTEGLPSQIIGEEIKTARRRKIKSLMAGIALVNVKNIHESTREQLTADLQACRGAEGLVISWDLWQTPLQHLELIQNLWEI